MSLGYAFFRVTSDIEKLSFPMAYVAAGGATALAETTEKKETWRWEMFSIGGMIGLVFGAIYVTIPTITGLMMAKPLTILPIPFIDFTPGLSNFLPAVAFAVSTDLGALLTGMIIPFWMVAGIFMGGVVTNFALNPAFYKAGILTHWKPGMGVLPTSLSNSLDLWLSVSIGMSVIVAAVGIRKIFSIFKEKKLSFSKIEVPKGRGDISISFALIIWAISTLLYIILCNILVPDFPLWIIIIFGFILTPLLTYISARMLGLGSVAGINFPYLKEGSFILSGYRGAAIWFAPVPYYNHAWTVQGWKMADLVRVKFKSIIKASILGFVVTAFCSFIFWGITWKLGSIPSAMYPYVQKIWPYEATFKCLWTSATMEGGAKWMLQAIKPGVIICGGAIGALIYFLLNLFGAPTLIFYGILGGIGGLPFNAPAMFIGALMGRYIFSRKYGKMWRSYTPILLAGYGCGMGLVAMASIAIALIGKSISQLIF
ncbi:peptide transporter [Candidatus Desantisbacteria bacterium CG_4_10_14_0_8_um_filter_39_17]|nr:MAG: peptide transporter [Candidatus Desantisbacteria bacterium CG_4_10_14_0_8_um_filter_39_17]